MEIVNANCKPRFNHQYALSMLHAKGYRIAVASNSIRNTVEVMMRYAELEGYLDFIISNEDVTKAKPDPEMYSLAISNDGKRFVLGSAGNLYLFDAGGERLWRTAVPSSAWAVNLSADGRFVVVSQGDGTVRWYRTGDGSEALALFVHADGQRWVLWSSSGYYEASLGGEDLIGWHVNRGLDQAADYFPASRWRDRYYRPELVGAVLRGPVGSRTVCMSFIAGPAVHHNYTAVYQIIHTATMPCEPRFKVRVHPCRATARSIPRWCPASRCSAGRQSQLSSLAVPGKLARNRRISCRVLRASVAPPDCPSKYRPAARACCRRGT